MRTIFGCIELNLFNDKGIAFAVYFEEVHATWVVFYIELEFLFVLIQELTLNQLALHVINLHGSCAIHLVRQCY